MEQHIPTLLVVDDEAEIREIIELHASAIGFTVLEAGDGQQAIEVLTTHEVDIVVSDLMMPRLSGISLLGEMRERGFIQPFIIVTAFPSQDSTIQALRLGAFDYLEKPFDSEELKALMAEALRVSQAMQGAGLSRSGLQGELDESALLEIQKLKSLRFKRAPKGTSGSESRERESSAQLVELFISETTPQLLFCEVAIKGLGDPENRSHELGYLFRVMQTISSAARTLGQIAVAELAGAAERFYTLLRVRPRALSEEMSQLAAEANTQLMEEVSRCGSGTAGDHHVRANIIFRLTQYSDALEGSGTRTAV